MKMRRFNKYHRGFARCSAIANIWAVLFSIGCGQIKDDPFYDQDRKHFGNDPVDPSAEKPEVHTSNPPEGSHKVQQEPIPNDLEISEDQLVFHSAFRGRIVKDRIFFLYKPVRSLAVVPYPPQDTSLYEDMVVGSYLVRKGNRQDIDNLIEKDVNLVASQSYGNKVKSVFTQVVSSPTDAVAGEGTDFFQGDSESGMQIFDRVLASTTCPKEFVCIDRVVIKPKEGHAKTYCYKDENSGSIGPIPLGSSPGMRREDFGSMNKRYGPFEVLRYDTEVPDCRTTVLEPNARTRILITVELDEGSSEIARINGETAGTPVSYGISFEVHKLQGDQIINADEQPYVDHLAGLHSKSVYYLSERGDQLLRIVKTIHKPLLPSYYVTGYVGVSADVQFEFCQDLLFPDSPNLCVK